VYGLRIQQLLTHTSGLPAGLPPGSFPGIRGPWFRQTPQPGFSLAVADSLYAFDRMGAILWNTILSAAPTGRGYRYSDLNMMLLRRLADTLSGQPMDMFLEDQLYRPLGLQTLGFTPRELRNATRLVPTAGDVWREQLLQGVVHDPAAALLGGVSGHAGLFSNAMDLGILGQMLLNGGTYGGTRFFRPETVALFTRRHTGHRGLGFDLPAGRRDYPVAYTAPATTYGHTGFTGTCLWVDPVHELVFVFLSNRVHPDPDNNRLNTLEVRQRVHQVVYEALMGA
jgi:CubicO group peptidase (beta-lactamase class C family)